MTGGSLDPVDESGKAPSPPLLNRAFLALPIPFRLDRLMGALQEAAAQHRCRVGFPHPDDIHLTLVFLGAITLEQSGVIRAGVEEVAHATASFTLKMGKGGVFGPAQAPRILWIGLEPSAALDHLQAALAAVAARAGIPLEKRPFSPHLTLGRFRSRPAPAALTSMIRCINNTSFAVIPVDRVLFMNSQHNGPGPRYATIQQSILKGYPSHGQSQNLR